MVRGLSSIESVQGYLELLDLRCVVTSSLIIIEESSQIKVNIAGEYYSGFLLITSDLEGRWKLKEGLMI